MLRIHVAHEPSGQLQLVRAAFSMTTGFLVLKNLGERANRRKALALARYLSLKERAFDGPTQKVQNV